jgi:hypothetical protein
MRPARRSVSGGVARPAGEALAGREQVAEAGSVLLEGILAPLEHGPRRGQPAEQLAAAGFETGPGLGLPPARIGGRRLGFLLDELEREQVVLALPGRRDGLGCGFARRLRRGFVADHRLPAGGARLEALLVE